jgi:hypothetical protein
MDPNATLREMLELANAVLDNEDKSDGEVVANAVNLADAVLTLDAWLRRGGFLPTAWRQK